MLLRIYIYVCTWYVLISHSPHQHNFFFLLIDLDTFGPGSAALGPPAEMTDGEIEGRLQLDPKRDLKIDLMQSFPVQK